MPDLAFYNAGCSEVRGWRRLAVLPRRLLRRLLRPIFLHQVALFQYLVDRLDEGDTAVHGVKAELGAMTRRQDELDQRVETVLAFGWDYVALVRRLAVLEDQLAILTGHAAPAADEADPEPSILIASFDPDHGRHSKVC